MELFLGHDEYHDRDYLLTEHDDGTRTIATRPGMRESWTTWSAPVTLAPEPSEARA